MKKWFFLLIVILLAAAPCLAEETYHIEILQLGDVEAFDSAYDGLLDGLARQGLVKGYNLSVKRSVIDIQNTASLWGKLFAHMTMKKTCSMVIRRHPDLVITLGTPATHYFQENLHGNYSEHKCVRCDPCIPPCNAKHQDTRNYTQQQCRGCILCN
jgi:ABC-type uncharacterized transport system substrate-binding protein